MKEMKGVWNGLLLVVWLLSQSLSFALPASPKVAEWEGSPGTTWERAQPGSHAYDTRFPSYVGYDADRKRFDFASAGRRFLRPGHGLPFPSKRLLPCSASCRGWIFSRKWGSPIRIGW